MKIRFKDLGWELKLAVVLSYIFGILLAISFFSGYLRLS